jgi:hypothetical protein
MSFEERDSFPKIVGRFGEEVDAKLGEWRAKVTHFYKKVSVDVMAQCAA